MRFTYEEIKAELKQHLDEVNQDNLNEWADGFVPVYYNEIIKDWQEMPSDYGDRWREIYVDTADATITHLMAHDLFLYYLDQCETAYTELTAEREEVDTE